METSEAVERSEEPEGVSPGEAIRLGSLAITGVAGGLLLGRVLKGLLRMSLSSIVPVVFYQVLRKPAGSRKVIASLEPAESEPRVRQAGLEGPQSFPRALQVEEVQTGADEGSSAGFPVFFEQQSDDCLTAGNQAVHSPSTEEDWRDVSTRSGSSALSNAEWAAGLLDEIEDKRRDTDRFERSAAGEPWDPAVLPDEDDPNQGGLVDVGRDSSGWSSGGEVVFDPGEITQAAQWDERGEPGAEDDGFLTASPAEVPAAMGRQLPADRVPKDDVEGNSSKDLGLQAIPRESTGMEEFAGRSVSMGAHQDSPAVSKSAAGTHSSPEEEVHDAFSVPFPGRPVAGVQAVEDPFTRAKQARPGIENPGALASVLLKEKRKPGKKLARGNVMLVRMGMVLIIGAVLGCGIFLAWQAMRGTGDARAQSLPIVTEGNNAAGSVSEAAAGQSIARQGPDSPEEAVLKPAIADEDLPSFRSLE